MFAIEALSLRECATGSDLALFSNALKFYNSSYQDLWTRKTGISCHKIWANGQLIKPFHFTKSILRLNGHE